MPKDDKKKPDAAEAEAPEAPPERGKEPKKQLTRAELEALRRELQRKFH